MLFTNYQGKQMYRKKEYTNKRPIDDLRASTSYSVPPTETRYYIGNPPPAKYFRKTSNCNNECANTTSTSDTGTIEVIKNVDCCKTDTQKITRTANSNLSPTYFTTSSQLLKQRCKTYNQNITSFEKTVGSSQIRPDCLNCPNGNSRIAYYKRNNPGFNTQGAVSSSARLVRLKYNTVTTSSKFNPDQPRYRGDSTHNVFLQQYTPVCTHRVGGRTICR